MTDTRVREVRTFPDLQALSEAAAREIVAIARTSIAARGRFTIALSGGNTPKGTYELLADRHRSEIDWLHWEFVFGDERFVPPDDPRSNYKMAREALFDRAPVSADVVHPIPTDGATVEAAAESYERTLRRVLLVDLNEPDTIDLVLLGVGPDGHTASLFPGSPAIKEVLRWTRAVEAPTTVQPAVPRVTVTLPFLDGARTVMFLVAGADKRSVMSEILGRTESALRYPAALVAPSGRTLWMLEQSAAPASRSNA
jgi:6-phosphogluconolactonase